MNTIKDLLQKIYENEYEMSILKNKGNRLVRLNVKKDLPNGYRIEQIMEITPEFINSADPKYTWGAISDMFDKIIEHEKQRSDELR